MNIGKLPEEILRRSVLEQIGHRRKEVLTGPGIGLDCAVLQTGPEEVLLFSADPITGMVRGIGGHSIHITANDLAAAGAEPVAVLLTLLLPPGVSEADVRTMMQEAEAACEKLHLEILGGHTEITPVVTQPVIAVTGIGKCKKDALLSAAHVRPGQEIVISKWIGIEATAILAKERAAFLREQLPKEELEKAAGFSRFLSIVPEARLAVANGAVLMHDITEGGVYGALWEVAEAGNAGIEVEVSAIPVREETRRICACFGADPYRIMSSGSLLIVAQQGAQMVRALQKQNIPAAVIGRLTGDGVRVLRTPDGPVTLTGPQPDELYRALAR